MTELRHRTKPNPSVILRIAGVLILVCAAHCAWAQPGDSLRVVNDGRRDVFMLGTNRVDNLKYVERQLLRFEDEEMDILYRKYRTARSYGTSAIVFPVVAMIPLALSPLPECNGPNCNRSIFNGLAVVATLVAATGVYAIGSSIGLHKRIVLRYSELTNGTSRGYLEGGIRFSLNGAPRPAFKASRLP